MHDLLSASSLDLAGLVRERRVSARELVEAHLARVREANPRLNAIVIDLSDLARKEAKAADERLAKAGPDEALPPLLGVPFTIKESMGLAGYPQTSGLVARRHVRASADATTVARLRAAGAIPIGLTNVSELLMWMEADNRVYGRTGNARDPSRTCGGSSGGEGASVGSGMAPFGLGADIGGSIRMPAFFNGVFGHKPSPGLVPATGQYPIAHGAALRYLGTGPLARSAKDLPLLLEVLSGPDGQDPSCVPMELAAPPDLREWTVLDVRETASFPVSADLQDARERAVSALSRRGAKVKTASFPELRQAIPIWSAMLEAAGGAPFGEMLGNGKEIRGRREFPRWIHGSSPHTLPALALAILERIPKRFGSDAARFVAMGEKLRADLHAALDDRTVMPFPPHARVAPRHGYAMLPPLCFGYTAIFNVTEVPVTAVPMGLDAQGLPLGVQIVAGPGRDLLAIAAAGVLEEEFGGWCGI